MGAKLRVSPPRYIDSNLSNCSSTNYSLYSGGNRYTVSESYGYSLLFNIVASNSGTIVDGLSFQANAQSGYWSGFNVYLLGEPNYSAACYIDENGLLNCSGHNLVTLPVSISPTEGSNGAGVFGTAYVPSNGVPVACVVNSGNLQCSEQGPNVLQLVSWGFFGYPNVYMLGLGTTLEPGNYPVTLEIQPIS